MPLGVTVLPLRVIVYLTEAILPEMRSLLLSCHSGDSKRTPKQYRLLILLMAVSQKLRIRPS